MTINTVGFVKLLRSPNKDLPVYAVASNTVSPAPFNHFPVDLAPLLILCPAFLYGDVMVSPIFLVPLEIDFPILNHMIDYIY